MPEATHVTTTQMPEGPGPAPNLSRKQVEPQVKTKGSRWTPGKNEREQVDSQVKKKSEQGDP